MCRNCMLLMLMICSAAPLCAQETPEERRARLEALSPEEKEQLREKQESFASLDPAEQDRMRELHGELAARADAAELRGVLERYHRWLGTLSSGEKAELLSLPAEQRIERIKELMLKQEEQRFRALVKEKLSREDREKIVKWLGDWALEHKDQIVEAIPREFRPRGDDENRIRFALMYGLLHHWANNNPQMPRPTREEVQQFVATLSPQAQATYASVKDENRTKLAQEWVAAALWSRTLPPVDPEELQKFYVSTLSAADKEKLEALSRDEMQAALLRMYHQHHSRGRGGPPWQGRGGRGGGRDDRERDDRRRSDDSDRESDQKVQDTKSPPKD